MRKNIPSYRLMLPIPEFDKVKATPLQGYEVILPMNTFNLAYWGAAIIGAQVRISRGLLKSHHTRNLAEIMRDSTSFKLILSPSEGNEPIY